LDVDAHRPCASNDAPGIVPARRTSGYRIRRLMTGMVLAMLVCIYLGCVVAAACLASRFLRQGRMTRREALHYALLSRYPRAWYRR